MLLLPIFEALLFVKTSNALSDERVKLFPLVLPRANLVALLLIDLRAIILWQFLHGILSSTLPIFAQIHQVGGSAYANRGTLPKIGGR